MIKIDSLEVCRGKRTVLKDISIAFPQNEITGIIGRNGSGKTTLLRTIAGLNSYKTGKIYLKGREIKDIEPKERAKLISFMPQSRDETHMTVSELVALGRTPYLGFGGRLSKEDCMYADMAMEKAGVKEFSKRKVCTLSGGERQKVYIAMLLAQNTEVVLLDEPATFLDIEKQLELLKLISELPKMGKTVILIHHDIAQALKYSQNILLLDKGEAVSFSKPCQLIKSGLIEKVFNVGLKEYDGHIIMDLA